MTSRLLIFYLTTKSILFVMNCEFYDESATSFCLPKNQFCLSKAVNFTNVFLAMASGDVNDTIVILIP